jgi:hypothetical protein
MASGEKLQHATIASVGISVIEFALGPEPIKKTSLFSNTFLQ